MNKEQNKKYIDGVIMVTARGGGFVESGDEAQGEIKIEPGLLGTTFHGDTVRVLVHATKDGAGRTTGEVVEVLSRARETFVGTVRKEEGVYFLKPQNIKIHVDFIIPEKQLNGAHEGEKAIVRLVAWTDPQKNPIGEIIEVLGKAGVHETEMRAIVRDKGFSLDIPDEVEKEARRIEKEYPLRFKEEERTRRDFRGIPTFTIDPDDAKDFDDALSFKEISRDLFEIGVHIADVSFFVEEGSVLDKEAAERGTSIYLVDRTIPMLPEILSNDLASLVPGKDRLAFSAVFQITREGIVKERWFGRSIIRSTKRFTYRTAQDALDGDESPHHEELFLIDTIAKKFRAKRIAEGALTFDQEEIKFELDAGGKPTRIYKKERLETNKLIEDFMILANVEVATFVSKKDELLEKTFIYRVHDVPKEDRLKELVRMLRAIGYKVPKREEDMDQKAINKLFEMIGAEHRQLVETAAIQSMAKAIYSTKNIGHFGLSLRYYTHFTSPIRRYPDLVVHRLLARYLSGKTLPKEEDFKKYEAISRLSSQLEVAAADAERSSIKYKQAEYLANYIGGIREGIITGLTERGIFVRENETFAEGMIHLRDLKDDYYLLDDTSFRITGRKRKKTYTIGANLRIKIMKVDVERRLIDYTLA